MKKFIIAAIALTTTVFANAQAETEITKTQATEIADVANPDRVQIKLEELPEAVKKSLADDTYKGWTAKAAYIVNAEKPYYEVELRNTKSELNVVKFNEDGTVIK